LFAALLSMWMTNTVTTHDCFDAHKHLSVAKVIARQQLHHLDSLNKPNLFKAAMLLGLAYAATIGGLCLPLWLLPKCAFRRILK